MNCVTHVPGLFCYPCPRLHHTRVPPQRRAVTCAAPCDVTADNEENDAVNSTSQSRHDQLRGRKGHVWLARSLRCYARLWKEQK